MHVPGEASIMNVTVIIDEGALKAKHIYIPRCSVPRGVNVRVACMVPLLKFSIYKLDQTYTYVKIHYKFKVHIYIYICQYLSFNKTKCIVLGAI